MARQTHIVSFDDAKTKSRRNAGAAQSRNARSSRREAEPSGRWSQWVDTVFADDSDYDEAESVSTARRSTTSSQRSRSAGRESAAATDTRGKSQRTAKSTNTQRARRERSGSSGSRGKRSEDMGSREARSASRAGSGSSSARDARRGAMTATAESTASRRGSSVSSGRSKRSDSSVRGRDAQRQTSATVERGASRGAWSMLTSRSERSDSTLRNREAQRSTHEMAEDRKETTRETRRRERTKARANKMFDRQFSAEASAASSGDEGPRAALYEGKMGATHRRSTRMQSAGDSAALAVDAFAAKINPASWISALPFTITARGLRIATAAICIVLVCVTMYTPAQQYYQAQRERDQLSAEFSIIADRNETLDVQNDVLASDAGMEDAVREKYGYIKAGEETAVVTGLSEQATDTSRGSENIEPAILSSSVKAPEEWYTPFLDAFFGIE